LTCFVNYEILRLASLSSTALRSSGTPHPQGSVDADDLFLTWEKMVSELIGPKLGELTQGHFDATLADINAISAD